MGAAVVNGKLYNEVNFVDKPEEAKHVVRYDEVKHEKGHWLYLYHGYLVAVKKDKVE